ncbi:MULTISPECIES: hypothetical protein [unclassified Aeromicrobium]|uniref:hypothetical protein n=1 Tax=unclassified Aeromicrobium TaxID=2633570 RepID=UPI00288B2A9D|nr:MULTISPECIES: hypothetical protein [unclassified Aeromicrobium]
MTGPVALPLIDAAPQQRELGRVRVAVLESLDYSVSRALVVEDPVPNSPLGKIEKPECRHLELVLEQPQVSTVVQMPEGVTVLGKNPVVIDLPEALNVEMSELRSQSSPLLL